MSKRFPVVWLTGNTGAGKSTLAQGMKAYFNDSSSCATELHRRIVVLDGDEMRATISTEEGLSPEDRRRHNLRVARLANLMSEHGFLVLVAVIAPFSSVREELSGICHPLWVHVKRSGLAGVDRPYEAPETPDLLIDNDVCDIETARSMLQDFLLSSAVLEQREPLAAAV